MIGRILPRSFYRRDTVEVARDLLGKVLVHGPVAGVIVETEAYPGGDDLASHSAAGITPRTKVIFGEPGHAYVYFSYGMHFCMNVVVDEPGSGGAVLIRAVDPLTGIDLMRERRGGRCKDRDLANGPGKVGQAMGITLAQYGADLTRGDLTIHLSSTPQKPAVEITKRIGITKCPDLPYRFLVKSVK